MARRYECDNWHGQWALTLWIVALFFGIFYWAGSSAEYQFKLEGCEQARRNLPFEMFDVNGKYVYLPSCKSILRESD